MGRQHFGGDLKGRWILTAGLGGMGGAQPLAAVMAGAHCIASNARRAASRSGSRRATSTGAPTSIDEALEIIRERDASRSASACSATPPKSCPRC